MQEMTLDDRGRGDCYSLLASLMLTEPRAETLPQLLEGLGALLEALGEAYHPLGAGLSSEALAASLRQQYYDVFFVPKSGRYVPLYASSLLGYDPARKKAPFGLLSPKIAAQVQAFYDSVGFDPRALGAYAPWRQVGAADNVGFELAFMAALCHQQAQEKGDAARQYFDLQARFLRQQLLPCLPNLHRALSQTDAELFRQTALAALLWARCDDAALKERYQ